MLTDNLSTYIARIRRWLRQPDSSKSTWTDEFLKDQLNVNYRIRCAQIIRAHEGHFVNTATRDLTANVSTYPWPAGMERCNRIELIRSDGTQDPIQKYNRHFERTYDAQQGGDQYFANWRPISSGFKLEPPPLQNVTGGLLIEYVGVPPELEANEDAWHADFPRIYDELIIIDTALDALDSQGLLETGIPKTILNKKKELTVGFIEYINNKFPTSIDAIVPLPGHYQDA